MSSPIKTSQLIINRLKESGSKTAKELAEELKLTTMGVRQHLLSLEKKQEVSWVDKKAERGRPTRYWQLTNNSNAHFADRHSELSLQLIESVQEVFGEQGLDKLISDREQKSEKAYTKALKEGDNLLEKVSILAKIREQEGYMATVQTTDLGVWLYENHCPICAAATKCQNFCRSELELFQSLFPNNNVERQEHIIEGARRCAYLFKNTL